MYGIWKIYITKQFIQNFMKYTFIWKIYLTKQFRNNLYEILKESTTKFREYREIKITFIVISYFAK
jgi:hypothetical protein